MATIRAYTETYNYSHPLFGAQSVRRADYTNSSNNSARNVKRKLVLKPQPHNMRHDRLVHYSTVSGGHALSPNDFVGPQGAGIDRLTKLPVDFSTAADDNRAYARFNGKLRYGGAQLGISFATWKQSSDMLVRRLTEVSTLLSGTEKNLKRNLRTKSGRHRYKRDRLNRRPQKGRSDPLANQVLEYEFGWAQLFSDFRAVSKTIFQHAIPPQYVRGASQSFWDRREVIGDRTRQWIGKSSTVYSANVSIDNPNLWLANRAGFLNLAGIAWDIIPWSFVVGMFVNVNQLLGSLTDEVGLLFTDRSVTKSVKMVTNESWKRRSNPSVPYTLSASRLLYKERIRVLNVSPPLSLQYKVPELNLELILIASALVIQRFDRVNRLIDLGALKRLK